MAFISKGSLKRIAVYFSIKAKSKTAAQRRKELAEFRADLRRLARKYLGSATERKYGVRRSS